MTRPQISSPAEPCLWMAAGVINYRLCDRQFDCDRCPLDAALRGDTQPMTPSQARRPAAESGRDEDHRAADDRDDPVQRAHGDPEAAARAHGVGAAGAGSTSPDDRAASSRCGGR